MTALPATGLGRLPLIGFIARDIARDINVIFYMLTIVVTLVTLAVMQWGVVALAMVALAMVPVMFCILIAITRG
ncbi:hypothetical protein D2N39_01950 [Gemmobacter lutimaris]|uniref:ABC transmembrane type-1 domain-containing protein n=1 Tax=Gemmobacter lutimaris TaxID=2306023 RepID=A0A398C2X0_9RHOB|nr:hypothetical protein [Gemmobacter lutimaris]RID93696.1 hypothetical protein D2N39_01950 [Gemmobacter lutimaris]